MHYSDHILILKIRSGKQLDASEALDQIHEQSFDMICSWICRNSGTRSDAKDVFQEVKENLVQKIRADKYERNATIKTYNFSVAKNNWRNKLRKKERSNVSLETCTTVFEAPINIEEELIIKERNKTLYSCIAMLSPREQEVLKLHCFDREKMSKIATIMGFKSEQAAKNFKCKAMKKLKTLILPQRELRETYKTTV